MKNSLAIFEKGFREATIFATCILMSATASAADIHLDPSVAAGMGAVLEGKIEPGDFDKFKKFVLENSRIVEIYLASPGGDLDEALRIGVATRMLKLSTVVPSKELTNYARELAIARHGLQRSKANYMCASACFFIFVAGVNRKSDGGGPAILGIHRPALAKNEQKRLEFDQIAAAANKMRSIIANYLKVMDAPAQYAAAIFLVPSGRIRWIRNDEFDGDFNGFIPELRDRLSAKCGARVNLANEGEQNRRSGTPGEQETSGRAASALLPEQQAWLSCERDLEVELALHARQELVKGRK